MIGAICADSAGSMVSAVGPGVPSGRRRHEVCSDSQRPEVPRASGPKPDAVAPLQHGRRPGHDRGDRRHGQRQCRRAGELLQQPPQMSFAPTTSPNISPTGTKPSLR